MDKRRLTVGNRCRTVPPYSRERQGRRAKESGRQAFSPGKSSRFKRRLTPYSFLQGRMDFIELIYVLGMSS